MSEAPQTGVLRLYLMHEPVEGDQVVAPYQHVQRSIVVRGGKLTADQRSELTEALEAFQMALGVS